MYGEPESEPWPFDDDARRDDPLTEHRIAVTCSHPGWAYLVAFDAASEARPTEVETRMLASFLEQYKTYWYGQNTHRARMERRLLDVDGSANGVIFHKWGVNDWGFRRRSFTRGYLFSVVPPALRVGHDGVKGPLSLETVMDWMHSHTERPSESDLSPRWREWKAAHPEVFGS
ncbi:hypothetical protein E1091_17950 [Micromonospora fluostatini]|uniref:Uncharacterized protein n=1 Tax=Micromonospora fluostatini TaxID=1629071 RepID=A0ABY2DCM6_9ACTN|nr:hypothetical protein E1091_17950 [Micromonospora fluostatini]